MNTNTIANFQINANIEVAAGTSPSVELEIRPLKLEEIMLIGGGECLVNGL